MVCRHPWSMCHWWSWKRCWINTASKLGSFETHQPYDDRGGDVQSTEAQPAKLDKTNQL